jgi:two-component system response regulator MprA
VCGPGRIRASNDREATMSSRLLVVDDDDSIRSVLGRSLPYEGFDVTSTADGHHALRVLAEESIDCLILDVGMPGIDGLEVCRRLREAGDSIPIILLTAYDGAGDRAGGLEAGADDYLVKPFALEELVARLHALLKRGGTERDGAPGVIAGGSGMAGSGRPSDPGGH